MHKKTICSNCASYRRHVVWLIDRKFYCFPCGENVINSLDDVSRHLVARLSDNEADFEPGTVKKNNLAARPAMVQ